MTKALSNSAFYINNCYINGLNKKLHNTSDFAYIKETM